MADDFSGNYQAKNAQLQVKHNGDKITFDALTANAQGCTGEIKEATALLSGSVATFTGENNCRLVIDFTNGKEAVVKEESCGFYHGAECPFDTTYTKDGGLPKDVIAFLSRKEGCQHWAGEEAYDKDRAKEIKKAVNNLQCKQLDADGKKLQKKYKKNSEVRKAISGK
jgi:hypothetical protein